MPRDLEDVLVFLNLPADTPLPSGRKGKVRMKRLFRMVAVNHPYMKRRRRDLSCKLLIWARLRRGHPCLSADLKARSLVRARGKCKFWGPKIYTSSCGNDVCPVGIFPSEGTCHFTDALACMKDKIMTTRIAGGLLLGHDLKTRPGTLVPWPSLRSGPMGRLARGVPARRLCRAISWTDPHIPWRSAAHAMSVCSCSRMHFAIVASFMPTAGR
jgi:hypothetical protein